MDNIIFLQVGTNGLLSFGSGYNSFISQVFPGSIAIQSFYLVAPFWDDVDIRFDTGDISYEIHESGYYLDRVNAFIRQKRPTDFEGTWMMVVFYDAVHPFFGLFRPEVHHTFHFFRTITCTHFCITGKHLSSNTYH